MTALDHGTVLPQRVPLRAGISGYAPFPRKLLSTLDLSPYLVYLTSIAKGTRPDDQSQEEGGYMISEKEYESAYLEWSRRCAEIANRWLRTAGNTGGVSGEDVSQQVLLELWRCRESLEPSEIRGFVVQRTLGRVKDVYRANKSRKNTPIVEGQTSHDPRDDMDDELTIREFLESCPPEVRDGVLSWFHGDGVLYDTGNRPALLKQWAYTKAIRAFREKTK